MQSSQRQICFAGCRLKFNYNWKTLSLGVNFNTPKLVYKHLIKAYLQGAHAEFYSTETCFHIVNLAQGIQSIVL